MLELNLLTNLPHPDWAPARLFEQGENGFWLDVSATWTLFQDSAGTTPVTADGDPVGLIRDRSGNGNDAYQTTATARPTYKTSGGLHWLEFDGTTDYLVVNSIGALGTADFYAWTSMRTSVDALQPANPVMVGQGQTPAGEWMARATNNSRTPGFFGDNGTINALSAGTNAFSSDNVYGYARVGTNMDVYDDGANVATDATSGANLNTTKNFHIGGAETNATRFLQGRIYGLIFGVKTLSASERAELDTYLGALAGLSL